MRTPFGNVITRDEEELVINLDKDVEQRTKRMLKLSEKKMKFVLLI